MTPDQINETSETMRTIFASAFPTDKQVEAKNLLLLDASELRTDVNKWTDLTEFQQTLFMLMHPPVPAELTWYSEIYKHLFYSNGVLRYFSCVLIAASSEAKFKQMDICQETIKKIINNTLETSTDF